jgi:DUF1680 family protein
VPNPFLFTPWCVPPHPRIDALRGQLAVEKGPLVLAVEDVDLPAGVTVNDITIDPSGQLHPTADGALVTVRLMPGSGADSWPYLRQPSLVRGLDQAAQQGAQTGAQQVTTHQVRYRPYHRWGNRGPTTMRVWTPGPSPEPFAPDERSTSPSPT